MTTSPRSCILAVALCTFLSAPKLGTTGLVYNVPPNAAPSTLLAGETLNLGVGGSIGVGFTANAGSTISIQGGSLSFGSIAGNLDLHSGELGPATLIQASAVVTVHGGTVLPVVSNAGDFTVLGGQVQGGLSAGGKLTVAGGQVGPIVPSQGSQIFLKGGEIAGTLSPFNGTTFTMTGGTWKGNFWFSVGSTLNLSGGTVQDQLSLGDTILNLTVRSALVGGAPIAGIVPGVPQVVTQRDTTLSGVLADGTPFSFDMNSGFAPDQDSFPTTATVNVTVVPEPAAAALMLGAVVLLRRRVSAR
jgi:hypothetical protein